MTKRRIAHAAAVLAAMRIAAGLTAETNASSRFGPPERVTIEGYDGNAMEPFLSPDGSRLFFNNENEPAEVTDLHYAVRIGRLTFRYAGPLAGANSRHLDGVATMDASGRFYFTTLREYGRTRRSIYAGWFDGKDVHGIRAVEGIGPERSAPAGTVNMDTGISPDGETLYISRALIPPGSAVPVASHLLLARRRGSGFELDPRSNEILRKVNGPGLVYAPAISADGRELYFTRLKPGPRAFTEILVAERASTSAPFDEPRVLGSISEGLVEAPALSIDGREIFYHKRIGRRLVIYRAERRD